MKGHVEIQKKDVRLFLELYFFNIFYSLKSITIKANKSLISKKNILNEKP